MARHHPSQPVQPRRPRGHARALAVCLLLAALPGAADDGARAGDSAGMAALAERRADLTRDLEQLERTIEILHRGEGPPRAGDNPRLDELMRESQRLRQEILAVTERELALLESQLDAAPATNTRPGAAEPPGNADGTESGRENGDAGASAGGEAVRRLQDMIASYYSELRDIEEHAPAPGELAAREAGLASTRELSSQPIDPDQLLLSGEEGGALLRRMSERLADAGIPESRRDVAPICSIRTRRFGDLIASDNRSLLPVGKNQYVARVRLLSGLTTLRVHDVEWRLKRPDRANAAEFLVTYSAPPEAPSELHLTPVGELRTAAGEHLPAWLPPELQLAPGN